MALFYFTTLMPLGAAVVHAGIWFSDQGIGDARIGIINAVPILIMLGVNLSIGRIADRARDWRQTIVIAAGFQGIVTLGLFLVDGFWGVLAVWALSVMPNLAIASVLDAASIRLTMRTGSNFGALRACATIGYLLAVGLTGVVISRFGGEVFVPFYVGLMLLKAATAQILPPFRTPPGTSDPTGERGAKRLAEVMRPWFVLPLFGYAMVFGTHIILNAFAALLWAEQGIAAATIGQLIILGAAAEAAMMFAWGRVGKLLAPERALLVAGMTAALRWSLMAVAPPVPVLMVLQLFHAITFAMGYLACVQFIARHTRERIAAEAQSFFVVMQQGMSVIAVIGFGWLVGRQGVEAYFVAGGFALIGSAVIAIGLRARPEPVAPDRTAV